MNFNSWGVEVQGSIKKRGLKKMEKMKLRLEFVQNIFCIY